MIKNILGIIGFIVMLSVLKTMFTEPYLGFTPISDAETFGMNLGYIFSISIGTFMLWYALKKPKTHQTSVKE